MSQSTEQSTEQTAEGIETEIRESKDGIKKIVNCAGKRGLNIKQFAIEIWDNVLDRDVDYLTFAGLLWITVTKLPPETCFLQIEEMIEGSLSGNSGIQQKAINLMADGLVEFQKPIPKPIPKPVS